MRAGEYGIMLAIETEFDLAGCTIALLRWRPPGRGTVTTEERALALPLSGTQFVYITESDDFSEPGVYQVMVEVEFGATKRLRSSAATLEVERTLSGD